MHQFIRRTNSPEESRGDLSVDPWWIDAQVSASTDKYPRLLLTRSATVWRLECKQWLHCRSIRTWLNTLGFPLPVQSAYRANNINCYLVLPQSWKKIFEANDPRYGRFSTLNELLHHHRMEAAASHLLPRQVHRCQDTAYHLHHQLPLLAVTSYFSTSAISGTSTPSVRFLVNMLKVCRTKIQRYG